MYEKQFARLDCRSTALDIITLDYNDKQKKKNEEKTDKDQKDE